MPAKGQTCLSCSGECCKLIGGLVPDGSWILKHFRQCKVKTSIRHGLKFRIDEPHPCFRLTENGKCSIYEQRPVLCQSFYCYGKLWKPQGVTSA